MWKIKRSDHTGTPLPYGNNDQQLNCPLMRACSCHLPNTPWPWNALDLACLTLAHACSFTPAGTEFLALSSTTHIYTSEAFREPVPHYSASQLCIHPSLWSLEGASGMKVILKHQLPLPHDRSHHESTLRGASHSTWVSKELDHLSAWKGSRRPTECHKLLSSGASKKS